MYLWRAVDGEGEVLDALVQRHRNQRAVLRIMRKLLKNQGVHPKHTLKDKLKSYGAALRDPGLERVHETGHRRSNRAEGSHVPIRRRERKMRRFKSQASAQTFRSNHEPIYNLFNVQRQLISRRTLRAFRNNAMKEWKVPTAALHAARRTAHGSAAAFGQFNLTDPTSGRPRFHRR